MKKTITFSLNSESIQEAINEINSYKLWISEKSKELTRRLAEIGLEEASIKFSGAFHTGDTEVDCSIEQTDNGYKIIASGEEVCFIEFGTGVNYNGSDSYPGVRPAGIVGIGQYGKGQGQKDSWVMPNENGTPVTKKGETLSGVSWTHGMWAEAPLYYAGEKIKEQLTQIAKEVFSS